MRQTKTSELGVAVEEHMGHSSGGIQCAAGKTGLGVLEGNVT